MALIRGIARLALPAPEQIAYLSPIGVGGLADELALDMADQFELVPALVAPGCLDEHEARSDA